MDEYLDFTVVVDNSNDTECLYIDGKVWHKSNQENVSLDDLVRAADGEPFCLSIKHIAFDEPHDPWPPALKKALSKP